MEISEDEMKQVEETSSLHTPLAKMASAIYFAAERIRSQLPLPVFARLSYLPF